MADNSTQYGTSEEDGAGSLGQQVGEAVDYIRRHTGRRPGVGIILGSGLGLLADEVSSPDVVFYGDIPHFPRVSVEGHPGKLVIGEIEGSTVAALAGRAHFYEGYSMSRVTFPVRVLHGLGCEVLIVTNAAGGLNPLFRPGDVMAIADHVNLPGMAGFSPIAVAHDPALGPRFVSMGEAYDAYLVKRAFTAAERAGLDLRKGVYAMVGGPAYETQAEVAFLRMIGVDAVGMSTAPEVVVARQLEMRVLGLSCIANVAPGPGDSASDRAREELSHQEVLAAIGRAIPRLRRLLREFLRDLNGPAK